PSLSVIPSWRSPPRDIASVGHRAASAHLPPPAPPRLFPYTTLCRALAALGGAALLLGACGGAQDRPGEDRPTDPDPTAEEPTDGPTEPTAAPTGDGPGEQPGEVEAAIDDLATHLEISRGEVTVVSYQDVTWPDGAIGCPESGMSYTQALVPGCQLVLEVEGVEYAYHSGQEPDLVRCD